MGAVARVLFGDLDPWTAALLAAGGLLVGWLTLRSHSRSRRPVSVWTGGLVVGLAAGLAAGIGYQALRWSAGHGPVVVVAGCAVFAVLLWWSLRAVEAVSR